GWLRTGSIPSNRAVTRAISESSANRTAKCRARSMARQSATARASLHLRSAPLKRRALCEQPGRACLGRSETREAPWASEETRKMPKMKTKSGAKKRFKFTANGKIKTHQVGKRHRLINNSPARTRDLPDPAVLSDSETQRVRRWMPYG